LRHIHITGAERIQQGLVRLGNVAGVFVELVFDREE
jgi:hypothetical protein